MDTMASYHPLYWEIRASDMLFKVALKRSHFSNVYNSISQVCKILTGIAIGFNKFVREFIKRGWAVGLMFLLICIYSLEAFYSLQSVLESGIVEVYSMLFLSVNAVPFSLSSP